MGQKQVNKVVTIKDIAKKAGVSSGTVSNVLNKKGNTSLKKIQLVEQAAKELGYFFNEKASSLRANKKRDIVLIVPTINNAFYRKIFDIIYHKFINTNIRINIQITNFNSQTEINIVNQSMANYKYLIIASCLKDNCKFYEELTASDTKFIFINSIQKNKNNSFLLISNDYVQFFNDMNQVISEHNYRKILFFTDKKISQSRLLNGEVTTLVSYNDANDLSNAIELLYANHFDLIITTSIEKSQAISTATKILTKNNDVPIVSIVESDNFSSHEVIPYYQNVNDFIVNIVNGINSEVQNDKIVIPYAGFPLKDKRTLNNEEINLLMIESPATFALIKIKHYIEKKLNFKINIDVIKYNEYDKLRNDDYVSSYDLIRIDMADLPELAPKIFKPVNDRIFKLNNKFIDNLNEYIYVNDVVYALPFDVSCLIMMYRNDIINNQLIERQFYEQTKCTSFIPNDYETYNVLETFFQQNYRDIFYTDTICLGSSITASNEFLIRLDTNYVFKDAKLDAEDPTIRKALDSYLHSVLCAKKLTNKFWDDVVNEYAEGHTVLSIVYSNYIYLLNDAQNDILFKTSFCPTPNNTSCIGGGVLGLTKTSTKEESIYRFLKILYSDEISKLLTQLGALLPTKNIYNDFELITLYPWIQLIPQALASNRRRRMNRNGEEFSTIEFEKEIGRQVKKYIEEKL